MGCTPHYGGGVQLHLLTSGKRFSHANARFLMLTPVFLVDKALKFLTKSKTGVSMRKPQKVVFSIFFPSKYDFDVRNNFFAAYKKIFSFRP